jgi:hypothetical protein
MNVMNIRKKPPVPSVISPLSFVICPLPQAIFFSIPPERGSSGGRFRGAGQAYLPDIWQFTDERMKF